MAIREIRERAIQKLKPLNERMDRQYGVKLDLNSDRDHLRTVYEHYKAKRETIRAKLGEAAAITDPDYAKAVFISEAARLFLREISPKRIRKKTKK
jgi:hypothetical protein